MLIDGLLTSNLFLTASLYSFILAHLRRRLIGKDTLLGPDSTWIEVVVGVLICLFFGTLGAKNHKKDGLNWTIGSFWLAFLVGGFPVVCWQLTRVYTRWRKIITRGHDHDPPKSLAQTPRGR